MNRGGINVVRILAILTLASLLSQPVFGLGKSDSSGTSTEQAHEVGDLVVFGPAGTSIKKCGHSAMLHYQKKDGGTWKDRVIDSMPTPGVTVNFNVWGDAHGSVEGIFTVPSLADGSWSAAKQQARIDLVTKALSYVGSSYSRMMPVNSSDFAWTELTDGSTFISMYEGLDPSYPGTFTIQSNSTYATPAGAVDYKPYQAGGNPGAARFSCCGFTERVYEDQGLDITPTASTYTHSEIEVEAVSIWWYVGKAWMFWPKTQLAHGSTSVPKPPEITINSPTNDVWHKVNNINFEGYANDVSNMRDDKVHFTATYQADASPAPADMDFAVSYFSGPANETTFDDDHNFADDGYYKVKVDSYDGAGNHADSFKDGTTEFIVKVDTKKPTGSISVSISP